MTERKLLTDAQWVFCPDCRREVEAVRRSGKIGKHTVGTRTLGVNFGMPTQCEGVGKEPGTPPADADMGEDWAWQAAPAVYQPAEQPSVLDVARAYVAEARAVQGAVPEPFLWNGPASDGIGGGTPPDVGRLTFVQVDGVDITEHVTGVRFNEEHSDGEMTGHAGDLDASEVPFANGGLPGVSAVQSDAALAELRTLGHEPLNLAGIGGSVPEELIPDFTVLIDPLAAGLARLREAISDAARFTAEAMQTTQDDLVLLDGDGDDRATRVGGASGAVADMLREAVADGHLPEGTRVVWNGAPIDVLRDGTEIRVSIADADFGDNTTTMELSAFPQPAPPVYDWNDAPLIVRNDDGTVQALNDDGTVQALNADGSPWPGDVASLDTPPLPRRTPGASLPGGEA